MVFSFLKVTKSGFENLSSDLFADCQGGIIFYSQTLKMRWSVSGFVYIIIVSVTEILTQ